MQFSLRERKKAMTKKVLALLLNRPEINHYQSISFTRHLFYFYADALKQTWFVYFIYMRQ
jgi:hypothetical protein